MDVGVNVPAQDSGGNLEWVVALLVGAVLKRAVSRHVTERRRDGERARTFWGLSLWE